MSVYHQMGHHSFNLLNEPELNQYSGAIVSPVNYSEEDIIRQVNSFSDNSNFKVIFDPQLYYPRSYRGQLPEWSYFPNDVDTADIQSEVWWHNVSDNLVNTCKRINPDLVCSPAFAPRTYTEDYYSLLVNIGDYFVDSLSNTKIKPVQSVIVGLNDLSVPSKALQIASIISRTKASEIYLVFESDIVPRRELKETEELKGAMKLIESLENSGLNVIVAYCSSEFILWKYVGATVCATGKFFNLRRFTSSRFEETSRGGGQLPYWFEESLIAFLRESDLIRLKKANLIGEASYSNPFAVKILKQIENNPEKAWLRLSWRQYLYQFADLENRIHSGKIDINQLILDAEKKWIYLDKNNILMEELQNNGEWVRAWRRVLIEYKKFK